MQIRKATRRSPVGQFQCVDERITQIAARSEFQRLLDLG
jgi:hypothetical protein